MEKYNLNRLVKIEVLKREESTMFVYKRHQKKTFFQIEIQEGVYRDFFGLKYIDIDSREDITLIDFKVYTKDRVVLYFESGIKYIAYCDNYEYALNYAKNVDTISKGNFLTKY